MVQFMWFMRRTMLYVNLVCCQSIGVDKPNFMTKDEQKNLYDGERYTDIQLYTLANTYTSHYVWSNDLLQEHV